MAEETFLMVSLKESESKQIAQILANETCRAILNHLAEKESTESELAKALNLPISTIHYNLANLKKTALIQSKEFHYSEKGKEVNHYSLSKKYIVIAPSPIKNIKSKLKTIIPVAAIAVAAAGILKLTTSGFMAGAMKAVQNEAYAETLLAAPATAAQPPAALWFIFGALFAIVLYFVIDLIRKK